MSAGERQVYSAAELFNLAATHLNKDLVDGLEQKGIKIFSPQRDGFEFSQLSKVVESFLPQDEIPFFLNAIIYLYDINAVWKSDAVIARFDEPPDPGVDTEVLFANAAGIPVIAYRTDTRSPYGSLAEKFGGMHSFPIKESESLVFQLPSKDPDKDLQQLIETLGEQIKHVFGSKPVKDFETLPLKYRQSLELADEMFQDVDVHSDSGLERLASRYIQRIDLFHRFGPEVIKK